MPTVLTSVAVAIPPTTNQRIKSGNARPGSATRNARAIALPEARSARCVWSPRARTNETISSAIEAIAAGSRPAVNRSRMDTVAIVPTMISTRLGGIVSAIAPEVASSAIISLRL